MNRSLEELDEIVHDVAQTHLSSFETERGPYPGHGESQLDRDEQR